jgi:hypothetical protein
VGEAETRWVTYAELAEARGIDKASAIRLTLRRKWQRQKDNRGIVRVMVPVDDLRPSGDASNGTSADMSYEASADTERLVGTLEARIAALEADVTRERELAGEERKRADLATSELRLVAEARARAEGEVAGLREALMELRRPAWKRWLGLP